MTQQSPFIHDSLVVKSLDLKSHPPHLLSLDFQSSSDTLYPWKPIQSLQRWRLLKAANLVLFLTSQNTGMARSPSSEQQPKIPICGVLSIQISTKPARTPYPEEPMRPGVDANGVFDPLELQQYRILRMFREKDLSTLNYENKALHDISKLIFETTSTRMIDQVAYSDPDPRSKLVALKQRFKPNDQSRTLLVEKRYHQLARGSFEQWHSSSIFAFSSQRPTARKARPRSRIWRTKS
ncbi:hypothetical protein MMC22_001442 [Lobaria immixta]|nr:hypothetical protein [Lobaria immixta]